MDKDQLTRLLLGLIGCIAGLAVLAYIALYLFTEPFFVVPESFRLVMSICYATLFLGLLVTGIRINNKLLMAAGVIMFATKIIYFGKDIPLNLYNLLILFGPFIIVGYALLKERKTLGDIALVAGTLYLACGIFEGLDYLARSLITDIFPTLVIVLLFYLKDLSAVALFLYQAISSSSESKRIIQR